MSITRQIGPLLDYAQRPDPRLRIIIAIIWAILFWSTLVSLWRKQMFARRATPIMLLLYALFELGFAQIFIQTPLARDAWLPNGLFYLSIILFAYWALNRSAANAYFSASHLVQG
jgi:CDP-diglyceride synthetase